MITKSTLDKDIQENIKKSTNFDNDFQYNGVSNLAIIIQHHSKQISEEKTSEIVDAILNHLDSDDKNLQNNAVKCLGQIILNLSTQNCRRVVDRILTRIVKPQTKQAKSLVDLYANGLVTIVKQVGYQYGYQLKDLAKMTVDAISLVKSKINAQNQQQNIETQVHLINVAEAFMSKWPKIIQNIQFDKEKFVLYLMGNIGDLKLSKRSYLCLGALAYSLKEKQLNLIICNQGGLLNQIKGQKNYQKKKEFYYALAAVLKTKNLFLANMVPELYKFLINEVKQMKNYPQLTDDIETTQLISKLLDCVINCINFLVQGFSHNFKEVTENVATQLVSELKELFLFSPRLYIQYIKQQENQQEEEYEAQTDSSYLVRAAALELVGGLSCINPKLCQSFIDCGDLFQSLKESRQEVRTSSFNMFQNLFLGISKEEINQISVDDLPGLRRQISVFKQKVPPLLTQILAKLSELLKNEKVDLATKIGCARLLRQIPRTFLYTLSNDNKLGLINALYDVSLRQLKRIKILDIQILLTNTIQFLARYRDLKYSIESLQLLKVLASLTTNESFWKAIFTAIANHLCQGYDQVVKNPQLLNQISALAQKFAVQKNPEQSVRISINQSILMIINHYHSLIPDQKLISLLKIINNKLTTQTNKVHLLNGLKTLPQNFKVTPDTVEVLSQIVLNIAANLINNRLTSVKQGAHLSILAIISIVREKFKDAPKLFELSGSLIDGRQFPQYLIQLSKLSPGLFAKNLNRLLNLQGVEPIVIKNIIQRNKISVKEVMKIIKDNLYQDNFLFSLSILNSLGVNASDLVKEVNDTIWGSLCLRLIGLSGDSKYFDFLHRQALSNLNSKIRQNARIALGDLAACKSQSSIPHLMKEIREAKQEDLDLIFVSLQQCIMKMNSKSLQILQETIKELFQMVEQGRIHNESVINRISQCAAQLYNLNPTKGNLILQNIFASKIENLKYLFAVSINYIDSSLFNRELVTRLIDLYSNDNLRIKVAAAKSLSHLINVNPSQMQQFINPNFFNSIKKSAKFDESLVVIEMIGVKTRVDKGKALRIQSFSILEQILTKNVYNSLDLKQVIKIALDVGNDIYEDVLLHRLDLIRLVTEVSPRSLIPLQNEFVGTLQPRNGLLKSYVRQEQDEISRKMSLNVVRKVFEICSNIKKENSLIVENLYLELKSIGKFKPLLDENND